MLPKIIPEILYNLKLPPIVVEHRIDPAMVQPLTFLIYAVIGYLVYLALRSKPSEK